MPHIIDVSKEKINLEENESSEKTDEIHGLLVTFSDDQLNDCVNSALKKKSRVKYRCMDTFANFLAFGTSGGAIYLYKLKSMTHASCSLASIIACDQGSIEVVKFLPNPQTDDLLIAIGTSRGSLVVFRLCQLPGEDNPSHSELYRAGLFTNGPSIKMIECDLDLLDPTSSFTRLYICDAENRLYCLESSYIYNSKQMLRLKFYVNNYMPTLILSLTDSNINQISVHRSQLLISTDETTRLFNDHNYQLHVIGKKKRKEGYYGACFFNPAYKPAQILPTGGNNTNSRFRSSQQLASAYSSTNSLADLENLMIFVARPMFRLWQVNCKGTVMFTHQFESMIRSSKRNKLVELSNEPLEFAKEDDPKRIMNFIDDDQESNEESKVELKSDHFCKIVPIHSPTLGNLLLSHTKHELFIVDPVGAQLIVWYSQKDPIIQVCCNENEFFVWSLGSSETGANNYMENGQQKSQFKVQRLVLLAPTQFVLELHRLHRYLTMMAFIERFESLFRRIMALPLSGVGVITTEGGLLRNVLMNAWDIYETKIKSSQLEDDEQEESPFKKIIDEIISESKQLKQSIDNLTDSRFFLTMTSENIERLCSEPYTSLISLEISLANLHSNRVIHFSKEALNRHKSVANLSQSIKNLNMLKQMAQSNYDLTKPTGNSPASQQPLPVPGANGSLQKIANTKSVVVERQKPRRQKLILPAPQRSSQSAATESESGAESQASSGNYKPVTKLLNLNPSNRLDIFDTTLNERNFMNSQTSIKEEEIISDTRSLEPEVSLAAQRYDADTLRCRSCLWPRPRSHLKPIISSQRIQQSWIEDTLMGDFEQNVAQIEEHAFKHGLWQLLLRCLAHQNKLDDYITCCVLLDDVRLLNTEQFDASLSGEDNPIFDKLLEHLIRKIDLVPEAETDEIIKQTPGSCYKCGAEYPEKTKQDDGDQLIAEPEVEIDGDKFSYNLVNLFEQLMMIPDVDIKKLVSRLRKYPKLLNKSKIPASFYLKTITVAVAIANQSPLSRARLNRLKGSSEAMMI